MEAITACLGRKRLCLSAAAALCLMGTGFGKAEPNPWGDSMLKFNIPYAHGSGVFVDLGNRKTVKGKDFREPAGKCPVMGKTITLLQPTTDTDIWPNDYLARVPSKGSAQDTRPLGGGFAMWEGKEAKVSPLTLEELETLAETQRAKNNPDLPASKKLEEVVDDHGLCAWWAWATFAQGSGDTTNLDSKYRYPFVWDDEKKVCTILAVAMQLLDGPGKYCTAGNSSPQLTWYCFYPEKSTRPVSYNSPYVRPDHEEACPEKPVSGVHFGVWNGELCARIIPRRRIKVNSAEECGQAVFNHSASDNPTKYTRAPDTEGLQQDGDLAIATLWPVGAFGSDRPHSNGVGINYANWYSDGFCELYDAVPTCFVQAPGQLAYTALGTIDPQTAELPPCNAASEGWQVTGYCDCGEGYSVPWTCTDGEWVGGDDECECDSMSPVALGVGLGLAIPIAAVAAYFFYRRSRKQQDKDPNQEKTALLADEEQKEDEFLRGHQREKHKQSDLLQEAEPSFWGETTQDQTNVVLDDGPSEAYY